MRYEVQHILPGHLLDGGAEVLQRYAQFRGIELRAAFGGVVLDDQLYELTADFLFPAFILFWESGRLLYSSLTP